METNRPLDYASLIKHQITSQEVLFEYHSKIEAMIEMILANGVTDFPREKLYHYFWAMNDLVYKAKELNTGLLDMLFNLMSALAAPQTST
jgi:hypothetical protein